MKKRILIVEDDLSQRPFWEYVLFRHFIEFELDWAIDCESAKELYLTAKNQCQSYDMLVLDLFLSGPETGLDFLHFLGQQDEKSPVLLVSTVNQNKLRSIVHDLKVNIEFLTKPLNVRRIDCLNSIVQLSGSDLRGGQW